MTRKALKAALIMALASASAPASAAVQWTDWTSATAGQATGTLAGTTVTYTGSVGFAQTAGGTNYFNPWPGTDVPPAGEMVALNQGGTAVVTFSSAVQNLYMAFVSWNGQPNVTFSSPFSIVASGAGYWGSGSITPNGSFTAFSSSGEFHGTLLFQGPITTLTFTHISENWHGFTFGTDGLANGAVPEPATWLLMLMGFGALGVAMRRRPRRQVSYAF